MGRNNIIVALAVLSTLYVQLSPARAQDQWSAGNCKPNPAGRAAVPLGYPGQDQLEESDSSTVLGPDTRPLTGVQGPILDKADSPHSYWIAGIRYTNTIRSTALNQANNLGWNATNYIAGDFSLLRDWSRSRLAVNYSAGSYFSQDAAQGDGSFQQLELNQSFKSRKWQIAFLDQFSYLPETSFGFGLGTDVAVPGVGGPLSPPSLDLRNNYQPSQNIFTAIGRRYSNSVTVEGLYELNPRSSINLAGSYGVLRFLESGNINSNDAILNLGYNYILNSQNTIGMLYRFTEFQYLGNPQTLSDQAVQASYGRRVTGRLVLQLFVGPETTTLRVPIGGLSRQVRASGGATLNYASGAKKFWIAYTRGLSNGSGIQVGSNADQVQAGLGLQVSREWRGNIDFGYARNGALGNPVSAQSPQAFHSYYAGLSLSRPVGRASSLSLAYTAQIQTTDQPLCLTETCKTHYTQHQITLALSWHTRPFVLR
jgi:hypothetical protein